MGVGAEVDVEAINKAIENNKAVKQSLQIAVKISL